MTRRPIRAQNQHGNARVDVQFNVLSGTPEAAVVTDGRRREYQTLLDNLQPGAFYVLDRAWPHHLGRAPCNLAARPALPFPPATRPAHCNRRPRSARLNACPR